jgi:hypothetical protein
MTADRPILAPLKYLRVTPAELPWSFRKLLELFKKNFITDGPAALQKANSMWTNATPNLKIIS